MDKSNKLLKEEGATASEYALKVALHIAAAMHQNKSKKAEDTSMELWQPVEKSTAVTN